MLYLSLVCSTICSYVSLSMISTMHMIARSKVGRLIRNIRPTKFHWPPCFPKVGSMKKPSFTEIAYFFLFNRYTLDQQSLWTYQRGCQTRGCNSFIIWWIATAPPSAQNCSLIGDLDSHLFSLSVDRPTSLWSLSAAWGEAADSESNRSEAAACEGFISTVRDAHNENGADAKGTP